MPTRKKNPVFFLSLTIVAIASCSAPVPDRRPSADRDESVLLISDIHFNPFYDPAVVPELRAASHGSEWAAIFEKSGVKTLSPPKQDTNYPLLRSTLDAIASVEPDPQVVLVGGDFLEHGFSAAALQAAGKKVGAAPIDPDVASFAGKTIEFVASLLRQRFPNAQILATVGNNDSACGDYEVGPNESFLETMANAFAPSSRIDDLVPQFSHAGNFVARMQGIRKLRVVAFDDVYWTSRYRNACGTTSDSDLTRDELDWLRAALRKSQEAGEKVLLLNHVPAGMDASGIALSKDPASFCKSRKFAGMLKTNENSEFLQLLSEYRATVTADVAAHTHSNGFRVYGRAGDADPIPALVVPSVSPVHGNNPAFQIMRMARASAEIEDVVTYTLDLSAASPQWKQASDFQTDYRVPNLSGKNLAAAADRLRGSPDQDASFVLRMTSGAQPFADLIMPGARAFVCEIASMDEASFGQCFCGDGAD